MNLLQPWHEWYEYSPSAVSSHATHLGEVDVDQSMVPIPLLLRPHIITATAQRQVVHIQCSQVSTIVPQT